MSENTAKFADQFLPVFQRAAAAATAERRHLQDQITALNSQRAELDAKINDLQKQSELLESDIAVALRHAAQEAGLKLDVTGQTSSTRGSAGSNGRSAQVEREAAIAWLKQNKGRHKGEKIKAATGMTRDASILLRDVKEVNREGERRARVYWIE